MPIPKKMLAILLVLVFHMGSFAQEVVPKVKMQIGQQIKNLRTAHLERDVELANTIYHPQMILTSQSGKKYKKDLALKNIENDFEMYESSDIEFLKVSRNVVLTNYINERKYRIFDKGKYRLTAVWTKHKGKWKIISMQSSKVKVRKK